MEARLEPAGSSSPFLKPGNHFLEIFQLILETSPEWLKYNISFTF